MNKAIKKMIFSLFILISFFLTTTEVWDAYLSQGTEGYRLYTNLGNSSISNFNVSDYSGSSRDSGGGGNSYSSGGNSSGGSSGGGFR